MEPKTGRIPGFFFSVVCDLGSSIGEHVLYLSTCSALQKEERVRKLEEGVPYSRCISWGGRAVPK
jgi:hypothetical protein